MFFSLYENNVAKNCSFVHGNFNQLKPDIQIKVTKFHNPKNGSNFVCEKVLFTNWVTNGIYLIFYETCRYLCLCKLSKNAIKFIVELLCNERGLRE